MYFNHGLDLYMTLSSAYNPFKQFGPRSGSTFQDLIGVQTVWHFRGYDMLELNRCILTLRKTLTQHFHLWITLSNNYDPDQAQILSGHDLG